MNDSELSRAAKMAKNYGKKLDEIQPQKNNKKVHQLSDLTNIEKEEKLKKSIDKLRTFLE